MPSAPAAEFEIVIARALAACAHPYAAWRYGSGALRAWIVFAYFAAAYVTTFGALTWAV